MWAFGEVVSGNRGLLGHLIAGAAKGELMLPALDGSTPLRILIQTGLFALTTLITQQLRALTGGGNDLFHNPTCGQWTLCPVL